MINLTDQMIYRLGQLNTEQERISYQMSTGKILDKGSDDASLYARELYVDEKIRVYEGLEIQIEKAQAQNSVSDSSLEQVKEILAKLKTEIMQALNPGMAAGDKQTAAVNIRGMKDNLLTLINERVNGEYLFSGSDSTVRPFIKDATTGVVTYHGNDSIKSIAVEPNTYRDKGVNGFDTMFYDKDEANSTDALKFTLNERILDDNSIEWHLSEAVQGHALTFDINDTINAKTLAGVTGNQWVLSEATIGHKLTFDQHDSGSILDDNGVSWTINTGVPQLEKAGGSGTGNDVIALTLVGGDIYQTTSALSSAHGIAKLSIGTLRLREIDTNNMPGTSITVTHVQGNQYKTTEILSTTLNNAGAAVESFTTTDAAGSTLRLRHFDSIGQLVTTDQKTPLSVDTTATDSVTGLTIREYTLSNSQIGATEKFRAKHNIFDDIDLVIKALETNTTDTTNKSGPVGLRETLSLIDKGYDAANVAHSKLGGRNKIFELSLTTIQSKITHYNILSQEIGGADLGKVAMEMKALEMTYSALYSTITKMNDLSLVNFIR